MGSIIDIFQNMWNTLKLGAAYELNIENCYWSKVICDFFSNLLNRWFFFNWVFLGQQLPFCK